MTAKFSGTNRLYRALCGAVAVVACAIFLTGFGAVTFDANDASARTRTLKLYFTHTKESATITYKRNGRYLRGGLRKINRFLRDWRRNEPTKMDPRLLDLVWEVYRRSGSRKPIQVISGYRSPKTNAALRRRGRGVARRSMHMRGKALDFYLPDVSVKKLRALGLKAHVGGVGYYPGSFVHLDTGSVRHWPRMSRRQLARVFPRGRTLHIPSDGKPMAGYQYARAKYGRGGKKASILLASSRSSSTSSAGNFLKKIFGGDAGDEEEVKAAASAKAKAKKDKSKKARKNKPSRKKRKKDSLPGVELALAPRKEKRKTRPEANVTDAKPSSKHDRIVVPKSRPGKKQSAESLIASLSNSLEPAPLADRFGAAPATNPVKPGKDVEKSRFALAATPKTTVTQRAAEALARSSAIPRSGSPDRPLPTTTEEIKLALLGPARGLQFNENGAGSASKPASTAEIRNGSAPQFNKSAIERVIAKSGRVASQVMPVPVNAPRSIPLPQHQTRIDSAFSALSANTESAVSIPRAKPQRVASLESGSTIPRVRPMNLFGGKQAEPVVIKSARPPSGRLITGSIPRIVRITTPLQLGNLNGNLVAQWAISRSTRVGQFALLTAPRYLGVLKIEPSAVLKAPFSTEVEISRANIFSGQAIKRLAFAKFLTKELPKSKIVLVSRY